MSKINNCISCGSDQSLVYGNSREFSEMVGNRKFTQPAYTILKCRNCGLYYKDNTLDQSSFNEYYNSFNFATWAPQQEYPTEVIVEEYLSARSGFNILDYGCSDGRFISKFINQHTCYGYDIDTRALQLAKEKGIETFDHNSIVNIADRFDVIVLSDVFEHDLHPTILISSLLTMLRKEGVLIITTGYADAAAAKYDLANFWYFKTIQHVCMMGADYIKYLQQKFNLTVIKQVQCSHYKTPLGNKFFYQVRSGLFKFIDRNRQSVTVNILSRIPYLRKITRWEAQPYNPYSKDHIVLFLKKLIK